MAPNIGHEIIRLAVGHILLVVLWNQLKKTCVSVGFQDNRPKRRAHIHALNRYCACAISRDMYPLCNFKYTFYCLTPTLPIYYVIDIGLRWRIRGCLLLGLLMLMRNRAKILFARLWPIRGPGDQGVWKVAILLQKAHPCVNPRRLSHLAWKSIGEKSESHRDSHRNEVSPLTQGLNYRSVCEHCFRFLHESIRYASSCHHRSLIPLPYDTIEEFIVDCIVFAA